MAENSRVFMHLVSPSSGLIKGESTVEDREDWIELNSWNWKLGRSQKEDAIPEPSLLRIDKFMDRSTTAMLQAMVKGDQLRAKIIIDDAALNLLDVTILLEHVTIRDYEFSTDISDKGGLVEEEWTFDYRWITFEYNPQHGPNPGFKSVKLHRPLTAAATKPENTDTGKFSKLGAELLAGGISVTALTKVWDEILKTAEEEKNRPDGKSPPHATKTPPKSNLDGKGPPQAASSLRKE